MENSDIQEYFDLAYYKALQETKHCKSSKFSLFVTAIEIEDHLDMDGWTIKESFQINVGMENSFFYDRYRKPR